MAADLMFTGPEGDSRKPFFGEVAPALTEVNGLLEYEIVVVAVSWGQELVKGEGSWS